MIRFKDTVNTIGQMGSGTKEIERRISWMVKENYIRKMDLNILEDSRTIYLKDMGFCYIRMGPFTKEILVKASRMGLGSSKMSIWYLQKSSNGRKGKLLGNLGRSLLKIWVNILLKSRSKVIVKIWHSQVSLCIRKPPKVILLMSRCQNPPPMYNQINWRNEKI